MIPEGWFYQIKEGRVGAYNSAPPLFLPNGGIMGKEDIKATYDSDTETLLISVPVKIINQEVINKVANLLIQEKLRYNMPIYTGE